MNIAPRLEIKTSGLPGLGFLSESEFNSIKSGLLKADVVGD